MELSDEYKYEFPFVIPKKDKYLDTIWLKFVITRLPENYTWDDYFIFKYIKCIKIMVGSLIFYEINGLCLKINIDLTVPLSRAKLFEYSNTNDKMKLIELSTGSPYYLYIPVKLPTLLPLHELHDDAKLYIELHKFVTTPIIDDPPIKCSVFFSYIEKEIADKTKLPIDSELYFLNEPHCERIQINDNMELFYEYNFDISPHAKYLVFYADGNIEINTIKLTINTSSTGKYSHTHHSNIYEQIMYPYAGVQNILAKNITYIPINNAYGISLDKNKANKINVQFNFMSNNGGYIYILSEKMTSIHKNTCLMGFSYLRENYKMDEWIKLNHNYELDTEKYNNYNNYSPIYFNNDDIGTIHIYI